MAASINVMDGVERPSVSLAMDGLNADTTLASSILTTTSFGIIVERIFSHLPALSLNVCARVCKLWNTLVKNEKQGRRQYSWQFFSFENNVDNSTAIRDYIVNLPIEPVHCVAFFTSELVECPVWLPSQSAPQRPKRRRRDSRVTVDMYLRHYLPRTCQVTAMATDGIIGTSADMRTTEEVESKQALALLMLGKGAGLRLQSTTLEPGFVERIVNAYQAVDDGEEALGELQTPIPYSPDLRAIMFVSDESFCPHELGVGLYQLYQKPYVFGGFVDEVLVEEELAEEPNVSLLTFSGESLKVASVILQSSVDSKEEVEQVMLKLKQQELPEERSVAFMFACIGRGRGHYGEENVESKLFRKHFPQTPLLGFFGNGEIGYEYCYPRPAAAPAAAPALEAGRRDCKEEEEEEEDEMFRDAPPSMFHAYTTILTLMSWA